MKNRDFIPYVSFGDIQFGDDYEKVRKHLNSPYSQVYFDAESKNFSENYSDTINYFDKEYEGLHDAVDDINYWMQFLKENRRIENP